MTTFPRTMARYLFGTILLIAVAFSLGVPKNASLPELPTLPQVELTKVPPPLTILEFAYQVALADGFKNPQWLPGIIWQESKAGTGEGWRVTGDQSKNPNLGVGQVTFSTAKAAVQRYPVLWSYLNTRTDEELKARLIMDDKFNVRVVSKIALMAGINKDPAKALVIYNQGIGGAQAIEDPSQFSYTLAVMKHAERFKNVNNRAIGIKLSGTATISNERPGIAYSPSR